MQPAQANKSWQQQFNPDIDILSMDGQKKGLNM